MSYIVLNTFISAAKGEVFRVVADIRNFSKVIPEITEVEFLSEQKYGVGTKFRETRNMNGRKAATELEVIELEEDDYIRLISDAGGAVWDSVFNVEEVDGGTRLSLKMEAKPYKLLARIMTPFMKGFMRKTIKKDMLKVKEYCEQGQEGP